MPRRAVTHSTAVVFAAAMITGALLTGLRAGTNNETSPAAPPSGSCADFILQGSKDLPYRTLFDHQANTITVEQAGKTFVLDLESPACTSAPGFTKAIIDEEVNSYQAHMVGECAGWKAVLADGVTTLRGHKINLEDVQKYVATWCAEK